MHNRTETEEQTTGLRQRKHWVWEDASEEIAAQKLPEPLATLRVPTAVASVVTSSRCNKTGYLAAKNGDQRSRRSWSSTTRSSEPTSRVDAQLIKDPR